MTAAIQVHPHDVRDEGAERVVENIVSRTGITIISPEVSSIEERHPYPRGDLPHNPVRRSIVSSSTLEAPIDFGNNLPFRPRLSDEARNGNDYIADLTRAVARDAPYGSKVVPWLKGLNAVFDVFNKDISSYCVRTLDGGLVPTWLCPSKPESSAYVTALVKGVMERYGTDTVLLDRMRYPDWSGAEVRPGRMLACFCPECRRLMALDGIDVKVLERILTKIFAPGGGFASSDGSFVPDPEDFQFIVAWLAFRGKTITNLTSAVRQEIKSFAPDATFWLNLWPPSFAPFLGQDYRALGAFCDGAKHFPYHRLGGGADLKGLTEALTSDGAGRERVFTRLLYLLNLPYRMGLKEFAADGFPVDFVRSETARGKKEFEQGKAPIFSGIQIWDIPENEIEPACQAALAGGADGFFFYCYGWATLDALSEVGRILRRL